MTQLAKTVSKAFENVLRLSALRARIPSQSRMRAPPPRSHTKKGRAGHLPLSLVTIFTCAPLRASSPGPFRSLRALRPPPSFRPYKAKGEPGFPFSPQVLIHFLRRPGARPAGCLLPLRPVHQPALTRPMYPAGRPRSRAPVASLGEPFS